MMHQDKELISFEAILKVLLVCLSTFITANACAENSQTSVSLCKSSIGALNKQFTTSKGLDGNGNMPVDAGLIVHTIHGPGTGSQELNLKVLNGLPVDASAPCGSYLNKNPPVYLPWCGSNQDPVTHQWDDSSSWTYIRHDTLRAEPNLKRRDEVVCDDTDNKKYGLIFSSAYMNENDNLGCMYPLDGDTGKRKKMGCGVSENTDIHKTDAQGKCASGESVSQYDARFNKLLTDDNGGYASYAGSLVCSLAKPQFDIWVDARKSLDLTHTDWPDNEFVLWNWDTYSTSEIASNKYLIGIYYLTGCFAASDGNRQEAQAIADLYKKWSGVDVPVVNLSNAAMRAKAGAPFSCN